MSNPTSVCSKAPPLAADLSDEQLLTEYLRSQDRSLFEALIRRYEQEIYGYLCRYMGSTEIAEDAFQGTFLQIHLKCHQFDAKRRFRPWLYGIATHQAIDLQRRQKRHQLISLDQSSPERENWPGHLVGDEQDPLTEASQRENRRWVSAAVAELSDSMREVVELVYYRGLKYREAAAHLNIPVGTVKSRLHSAVRHLADTWNKTHIPGD